MTWIDLVGGGDPVLVVDGRVHLRPEDIADPELRRAACELLAEFERVRHLAEPVAETLARRVQRTGGPVSLRFPDPRTFDAALEQ
jgi:hypothetical protein